MLSEQLKSLFQTLGKSRTMSLATSADSWVTVRSMSFILSNQKLYFQTDKNSIKYKQIQNNNKVAVCWDNVQLEGTCTELGHPLSPKNSFFAKKYSLCFPRAFEKYSGMKDEVLFEITPTRITLWKYENGEPYREFFDCKNNTYKKEFYSHAE